MKNNSSKDSMLKLADTWTTRAKVNMQLAESFHRDNDAIEAELRAIANVYSRCADEIRKTLKAKGNKTE